MPVGAMTANVASNLSDVCQLDHMRKPCSAGSRFRKGVVCLTAVSACWMMGCSSLAVPEPRTELQAFAEAVARKDARAVHAMLDRETRRNVTVGQVADLLARDADEIGRRSRKLAKLEPQVEAHAALDSGQRVELLRQDGGFHVVSPGVSGASALTPLEAVAALRTALEAGSYAAVMQVLTPELREQVEQQRKRLVEALRYEEALTLTQEGEHLIVDTADGHRVILEQKLGVWRVHDFN